MARTTTYNKKMCEEICDKIAEGGSVKDILSKKRAYPSFSTWCRWKRENSELLNMYIAANQEKGEGIIERIEQTAQDVIAGKIDEKVGRLLIYKDQWLAGKFYPKMFAPLPDIKAPKDEESIEQIVVMKIPDNGRGK